MGWEGGEMGREGGKTADRAQTATLVFVCS